MSQKKSDIWKYFIKISNGGKCKICLTEVKTSGNTTNLRNHLLRKHKSAISDKVQPVSECEAGPSGVLKKQKVSIYHFIY